MKEITNSYKISVGTGLIYKIVCGSVGWIYLAQDAIMLLYIW